MTMGNENDLSEDSTDNETVMSETQHYQHPLGMGRFSGQVYISKTESESGKDSSNDKCRDSQQPALKPLAPRFSNIRQERRVVGRRVSDAKVLY